MANFLEIVPTTDGSYALPPLLMPPDDWLKVSDLHFDSPGKVLEIPSNYPDTLPAPCLTCGAWFHYPKDPFGGAVPGGVWILCIVGPCAGAPNYAWANAEGNPNPNTTAGIGFSNTLNSVQSVFAAMNDYSGTATPPITVAQVAAWCWQFDVTTLFAAQGPADGYGIGCAPGPAGSPCVNGYYYDPQQEACIPLNDITGHIPPFPIGQGGGGKKKTGNGGGQQPDDPELDEIGRCCVQTNNNLVLIQQEIQALQNSIIGNGGTPPLDPVTCAQLTILFAGLNKALTAIATAIGAAAGKGGTTVDLTPITTALDNIATALKAIADKPDSLAAIPPTSTTTVDDRFGAFLSTTLTQWVYDGTMPAADAQGLI